MRDKEKADVVCLGDEKFCRLFVPEDKVFDEEELQFLHECETGNVDDLDSKCVKASQLTGDIALMAVARARRYDLVEEMFKGLRFDNSRVEYRFWQNLFDYEGSDIIARLKQMPESLTDSLQNKVSHLFLNANKDRDGWEGLISLLEQNRIDLVTVCTDLMNGSVTGLIEDIFTIYPEWEKRRDVKDFFQANQDKVRHCALWASNEKLYKRMLKYGSGFEGDEPPPSFKEDIIQALTSLNAKNNGWVFECCRPDWDLSFVLERVRSIKPLIDYGFTLQNFTATDETWDRKNYEWLEKKDAALRLDGKAEEFLSQCCEEKQFKLSEMTARDDYGNSMFEVLIAAGRLDFVLQPRRWNNEPEAANRLEETLSPVARRRHGVVIAQFKAACAREKIQRNIRQKSNKAFIPKRRPRP